MTRPGYEAYDSEITWGARVEYKPEALEHLSGRQLSDEDYEKIVNDIAARSKESTVYCESLDLETGFDWTTAIEFADGAGGYVISFVDSDRGWNEWEPEIRACAEWNNDFAQEVGLGDERADEGTCVCIALDVLREFLSTL